MSNTYYDREQKPKTGDIIIDMMVDSPCLVTHTYGYRFERVKIGPKAKKFKPVMSNWQKPASKFKFIEHQDDIEWPMPNTSMGTHVTCQGDIFMDKTNHSVYYMAIDELDQTAAEIKLVDITSDDNFIVDSDLSTVWWVGNQTTIPVPDYTKDALEFLLGDSHYPQIGDIY